MATTFNHLVRYWQGVDLDIRTACIGPPRCFATPAITPAPGKLFGTDTESAIELWKTAADYNEWYELSIDDATGFFGDSACASERCPGVMIVGKFNFGIGRWWHIETHDCPVGSVKWVSVSHAKLIWFTLEGNTQFLSEKPEACDDIANERRCPGGSYSVLIGSLDPAGACTATSLTDISCANPITGNSLSGACEGYAGCTALEGRRIESVPFQYPSQFVSEWTEGVMVAVADDSDTAAPTTAAPSTAMPVATQTTAPAQTLTSPPSVAPVTTSPPTLPPTTLATPPPTPVIPTEAPVPPPTTAPAVAPTTPAPTTLAPTSTPSTTNPTASPSTNPTGGAPFSGASLAGIDMTTTTTVVLAVAIAIIYFN